MDGPRDVDASPVAWREAGEGDVVLFLHGLGGSRTAWEPQLEALSDRWRCVAWDMPGYGRSESLTPLTFGTLAEAVIALLDRLGAERAHLCGLSFGGQQALHTVLAHPERVASLVLADTSAAFGIDGTDPDEWKRARLDPLDAGREPGDIAEDVIASVAAPGFSGPRFAEQVAALGRVDALGLRSACACLPTLDVRRRLVEIEVPTLVIVGALDAETPVPYAEMLAEHIAGAALEIIEGVGHLTPAEAPSRFNDLVRAFLIGLPPSTDADLPPATLEGSPHP